MLRRGTFIQKKIRARYERILASLPFSNKLLSSAPVHLENVGLLVDVFASFALFDGEISKQDADITLDLLRHAYPEADHGWLARRLARSFRKTESIEDLATRMISSLSQSQRIELALQLYLLVQSSTERSEGKVFFLSLMNAVELSKEAEALVNSFHSFDTETEIDSIQTLTIGHGNANIELSDSSQNIKCKLFRVGQTLILQNNEDTPLFISGIPVPSNSCTRLRPHQRLNLQEWTISYADLNYFIDVKSGKPPRTVFLSKQDEIILAERSRSRNSFAKVTFKLTTEIEILAKSDLVIEAHSAAVGEIINLPNHASITPWNGTQLSLNQLREQALDTGGRVRLAKTSQSFLISNIIEITTKVDLCLTPGLAEPIKLLVNFNQKDASGTLEILKDNKKSILVNELPVSKKTILQDGCLIRLSPNQGIRCRFSEGIIDEERTIIQQLRIDGLTHQFAKQKVLDNINFTLNRGEMLCIMGPSGSGKSTLLSALSGQLNPTKGHVRLNEISLYQQHDRLSRFITYMPQEEALSAQLTVREHLKYAIKIRQPNLGTKETDHKINTILEEVSLQHLVNRYVGSPSEKSLSGGERSRLNLGLDLAAHAELYLLDEPIAGLSSKDSEHVVEALKHISRNKIVIASLHRPSPKALSQFEKVLLLDTGGRIAYFGTPKGMQDYFREAALELKIRSSLESEEISADFVFDVVETPLLDLINSKKFDTTRRFPPLFWQERFENHNLYQTVERGETPVQTQIGDLPRADDNMPIPKKNRHTLREYFRISKAHFWRATLSKFRSSGTLYSTLLQVPLLALIIAWTLRASPDGAYEFSTGLHVVTYLFLSMTVGMFLGLTNSATEILRDRPTLRRERNCRYHAGLYVGAKLASLSILAAIQSAIYITIGDSMLDIHGMWFNHWCWMTLTAITGTSIALFISAISKTERAALSAVPLILVPQLLLAGTPLIPFEEMNRGMFSGAEESRSEGIEPLLSRIIPLRYAYEGITIDQATENPFEKTRREITSLTNSIKKEKELALKYLQQGLIEDQNQRLAVLLKALTKLYALEATDANDAKEKLQLVLHVAKTGTLEDLDAIPTYIESEEPLSCASYFVNRRAEKLVLKQDIQRVDFSNKEVRNIFLAEEKYFGSTANPSFTDLKKIVSPSEALKLAEENDIPLTAKRSWKTSYVCIAVMILICMLCNTLATIIIAKLDKQQG